MNYINCKVCGKKRRSFPSRPFVYCSRKCYIKSLIGNKFREGKTPWNKGTKGLIKPNKGNFKKGHVPWIKSVAGMGILKPWNKGKEWSEMRGKNHPRWNGGSKEHHKWRGRIEWKIWRERIFNRDNYTCLLCGNKGYYLTPHHIKSFTNFVENRFDTENGLTVCLSCHYLIHSNKEIQNSGWYIRKGVD